MQELILNSLSRRAKKFFVDAHNETNQKYDNYSYEFHLEHVADVVRRFAYRFFDTDEIELAIAAAYGHDAVSDARLTFNDISSGLMHERLAKICCNLCEDVWGINRDERNSDSYYARISSDEISLFVKLCDRIANIEYSMHTGSSMFIKYMKEQSNFVSKLDGISKFEVLVSYIDDTLLTQENLYSIEQKVKQQFINK